MNLLTVPMQMKLDTIPDKTIDAVAKHLTLSNTVSAEVLFGGAKEIAIRHQGHTYRLRITRNDKLILTK